MKSWNGKIFRITGPEFTGHRWIPFTKASDAEIWPNGSANNRDADDLSHHRAHYAVTVMESRDGYIECRETNQMIAYCRSNVNITETNDGT